MQNSKIAWTDHTFNPWIGCTKISDGCANCYAESQDHRWGNDRWGKGKTRTLTADSNWKKVLHWNKEAFKSGTSPKVFCASMADIFDQEVSDEWRHKVFNLILMTPHLTWLLLTKRPYEQRMFINLNYPNLQNVWAGTTIENEENYWRIDDLEKTLAPIHWISYEPAIGPLELHRDTRIDWVICGGESGNGARPFDLKWARDLRDQCAEYGQAFFMKQLGSFPHDGMNGIHPNWIKANASPAHYKWDNPEQWPEDLRIREFPKAMSL